MGWSQSKRYADPDELMRFIARRKTDRDFDEMIGAFREMVVRHLIPAKAGTQMIEFLRYEKSRMLAAGFVSVDDWFDHCEHLRQLER